MITREFNLYLHAGHSIPLVINTNQYDHGEQWLFTLFNSDGTQYVPSSGAIVGIKSDNLGIINSGSVDSDGRVVINETQQMTAAVGKAVFELVIDDGTHGTANFVVLVEEKPGNNADLSESDISMIEEAIEAASTIKPYGSPLVASTVAGMTDHDKVYVYVGSETGYTSGHWYYYDGDSWEDGGVYNSVAVQTDTTLTLSGVAADAKKTGDEISDLMSQITNSMPYAVKVALDNLLARNAYEDDDALADYAVFHAWATSINLVSISAVFEQGENVVYASDSLDSLKQYLTVTASYDNGTTEEINGYTLSGTLEEETSTITVTYQGETATFTVTVTNDILYQLLNTTFTGDSSERVSSGIKPLSTDSDYTIAIDMTRTGTATADSYLLQCIESVSPYWGLKFQVYVSGSTKRYEILSYGATKGNITNPSPATAGSLKIVCRHTAGATNTEWKYTNDSGTTSTTTAGSSVKTITNGLYIGGNGFIGTVNSFTVLNRRLTDDQVNAFLGAS